MLNTTIKIITVQKALQAVEVAAIDHAIRLFEDQDFKLQERKRNTELGRELDEKLLEEVAQ